MGSQGGRETHNCLIWWWVLKTCRKEIKSKMGTCPWAPSPEFTKSDPASLHLENAHLHFQVSIRNKQTHMLAKPTVFFSSFPTWGCLSPQGPRVSQSTRFSFTGGWSWKVMRGKVELILYWMTLSCLIGLISFQPQNNSVRTTIISLCTAEGAAAHKG